jgi:hypothetical protein
MQFSRWGVVGCGKTRDVQHLSASSERRAQVHLKYPSLSQILAEKTSVLPHREKEAERERECVRENMDRIVLDFYSSVHADAHQHDDD